MPFRGKINNPSYVVHVAQQLADLKQVPLAQIAQATSENFEQLFTRVPRSHSI
jgi:TatD DNase family protein